MTAIPSGTKFVGISASVPTPENKSSQNNSFQEVYTIDDILAESGSSEIVDFLVVGVGGNPIAFRKQDSLIGGKDWYLFDSTSDRRVSYNDVDGTWEYITDGGVIYSVVSTDNIPPATDWDIVDTDPTETIPIGIYLVSGTIQEVVEQLHTGLTALGQELSSSEYTETIVNISSAQILAMGTTPIELLPAAGVGMYYDIDKIVLEYTNVSAYTLANPITIYQSNGKYIADISSGLITGLGYPSFNNNRSVCVINTSANYLTDSDAGKSLLFDLDSLNDSIVLTTRSSTNPTLGNGTLRVKIYHKTITFGA